MNWKYVRRLAACFLLGAMLLAASFGQLADVAKDPRLQKPVSIRLKIVPLPVALRALSKLCGVKLENVTTINDLKVTVLVQDVPTGVVLEKIGSVLGCQWKADGDLFRIGLDSEERVRRERYIEAEDAGARKEIDTELNTIAQVSSIDPAEAMKELNAMLGTGNGVQHTKTTFDPDRAALLKRAANGQDGVLGRFLANLDASKISAFWKGDVIVGNSAPTASAAATNGSVDVQDVRRTRRPPASMPMFVQYDPLLYQVLVAQRGGVRTVAKRPARIVTQFEPSDALAKLPFGKEVLAWDQPVPDATDLSKISVKADLTQSAYADKRVSIADYLEKAFDQTHVPVVADGFRTTAASKDLNRGAGSFTSWMNTLKKENHLFTRFDDGVLMVRHGGFWRLRRFEAPEEILGPVEAKAAKGALTLDDYAGLLAKLTPEQAKPFCIPNGAVAKFDTRPIEVALPALLFYGSLDARAIAKAMQDGIVFDQLRSSQRQLFIDAALEGVFLGAASTGFSEPLMRLSASGDTRGLGFLMRKGTVDMRGIAVDGQALLFGASMTESSTYKIPVAE